MNKLISIAIFTFVFCINSIAQNNLTIQVVDDKTMESIDGSLIKCSAIPNNLKTNKNGIVQLSNIANGNYIITINSIGYQLKTVSIQIPIDTFIKVSLSLKPSELGEIVVSSTRTNSRIENNPIKVEVLGAEEMKEENTIKPGNVASLLGDISSIQIQQTNANSGNANVRIQGLNGKYTQLLRDGLPQYDGFAGGFGIMQVPPLDLKQIEIIKGCASTLYGSDAIGGIINFISKTPNKTPEHLLTLNQSTLGETNLNAFFSNRNSKIGYTLFTGATHQFAQDVNKDGLSDVPQLSSINIHPRIFFYLKNKNTLALGFNTIYQNNNGGDMEVIKNNASLTHQFFEKNITFRNTFDAIYNNHLSTKKLMVIKASISNFNLNQTSNTTNFSGNQTNVFTEASKLTHLKNDDFLFGIAYKGNIFSSIQNTLTNPINFTYHTLSLFAQNTYKWHNQLIVETGLRTDVHNKFGVFVLPNIATVYKFTNDFYLRANVGSGYKLPNIFYSNLYTTSTLNNIQMLANPERSLGENLEVTYHKIVTEDLKFTISETFFNTQIYSPINDSNNTSYHLFFNEQKPIRTFGFDSYIRGSYKNLEFYFGYTFTNPKQLYNAQQLFIPLTPINRFANTIVYEIEGKWRFGFENSFNGKQYLFDGTTTKPYWFLATMVERKFKHIGIVLNAENLTDSRQTRWENIYTGTITNPQFKPLWAPLDGRVINVSVVWRW